MSTKPPTNPMPPHPGPSPTPQTINPSGGQIFPGQTSIPQGPLPQPGKPPEGGNRPGGPETR